MKMINYRQKSPGPGVSLEDLKPQKVAKQTKVQRATCLKRAVLIVNREQLPGDASSDRHNRED
jgi:hypothetical protein